MAISKSRLYAAIPTAREIRICETTEGYLCLMNQALYSVGKIEWCIYALFTQDQNKIREYCAINTQKREANMAQSLGGISMDSFFSKKGKDTNKVWWILDHH